MTEKPKDTDSEGEKSLSGRKILVVDDEPGIREILTFFLESQGYETLVASGGNEAFNIIETQHVDLVISDIKMPDGSGLELLQRVKEKTNNDPKIIIITGFSTHSPDEVIDLGAIAVLPKPVNSQKLFEVIRRHIEPMSA